MASKVLDTEEVKGGAYCTVGEEGRKVLDGILDESESVRYLFQGLGVLG